MPMPRFPKSTRPLRPASYRAAVRRFRQLCDSIEAHATNIAVMGEDQRSKQRLTRAIHDLSAAAQGLSRRHRQVSVAQEMAMLPNDYHPSHRCSCRDCLDAYPQLRADAYDAAITD